MRVLLNTDLRSIRNMARLLGWGEPTEHFLCWHHQYRTEPVAPPRARTLASLWNKPFLVHHWAWHQQYLLEFPEVMWVGRNDDVWYRMLTPFSQDLIENMHPKFLSYLATGEVPTTVTDDARIPRTGNAFDDAEVCLHLLSPFAEFYGLAPNPHVVFQGLPFAEAITWEGLHHVMPRLFVGKMSTVNDRFRLAVPPLLRPVFPSEAMDCRERIGEMQPAGIPTSVPLEMRR